DPPATFLRGKVTKIDPKDPNRIEIDVGSDRELKSGHTLDVYRLAPRPSYVGMLRILKVNTCGSIGEMVASKSLTQNPVKVGDIVASSLNK
ncbi:MAG: hypothetical protein HY260_13435, partial [Chloroflexi bacterium]|nr:hypothetical protein [Chloroflexota bacterium]